MIESIQATYGIFFKFFFLAFSALLPVVNPIGSAVIFLEFAAGTDQKTRKIVAGKIAVNSIFYLIIIQFAGTHVLSFFGITLPIVQVAGGFVLAMMGWEFLNRAKTGDDTTSANCETSAQLLSKVFYPLTFPITVGPGCMVIMLTLSAHDEFPVLLQTVAAESGMVAGVLLMCILVYFCYLYADRLLAKVSQSAAEGILKIISFILLCIGVQIMWHGIQALTRS